MFDPVVLVLSESDRDGRGLEGEEGGVPLALSDMMESLGESVDAESMEGIRID